MGTFERAQEPRAATTQGAVSEIQVVDQLRQQGQVAEAEAAYRPVLAADAASAWAHGLGEVPVNLGRAAEAEYHEAIRQGPN